MDESRRNFLRKVGYAVAAAGGGFPLLAAASKVLEEAEETPPFDGPQPKQWGMVIDIQKCLDEQVRRACIEACDREHNVPHIPDPDDAVRWIWEDNYENVFPDKSHRYTAESLKEKPVLVLCNHCTHPPCVKVCPTQATWKREQDGIVMMDMHRCIGCRYCVAACPYGSRSFNWRDPRPFIPQVRPGFPTRTKGVVEKCSFCAARLRDGRPPACVEAAAEVPGGEGALTFGDLSDVDSPVRKVLSENHTICRRPSLGTGPNVFYIV